MKSQLQPELAKLLARVKDYEKVCQFGAALQLCHQGLKEFPHSYELANHMGRYLLLQGRVPESIQVFQRLLRANPEDYMLASNLLFYRHYSSDERGEDLFEEHRSWCQKWTASIPLLPPLDPTGGEKGKIRLGFVSPDFRQHPVARFLEPLLREIDRHKFNLTCYARSLREDATTMRMKESVDGWHSFAEPEIGATAAKIREDRIDVLFDLAGHTPGQSLMLFASRPAPIQCTYLGYPNTTGLATMDYRLVDALSDPVGLTEKWNTEKLVRLPETAWCYQPSPPTVVVDWSPPSDRNGYITFGSFNALGKLSDATLKMWAKILIQLPHSRLLVKNYALHDLEGREVLQRRALLHGLPLDRLELVGGLPEYLHYQAYRMVDIMLDSFPYHGTTTTCEALWMGVPVLTVAGKFHLSRVGVSLLHQVKGDELVAMDADDYVARAVDLANDPARLRELHHGLRDRMSHSPLMDASRFARNFERAVEEMVRKSV